MESGENSLSCRNGRSGHWTGERGEWSEARRKERGHWFIGHLLRISNSQEKGGRAESSPLHRLDYDSLGEKVMLPRDRVSYSVSISMLVRIPHTWYLIFCLHKLYRLRGEEGSSRRWNQRKAHRLSRRSSEESLPRVEQGGSSGIGSKSFWL